MSIRVIPPRIPDRFRMTCEAFAALAIGSEIAIQPRNEGVQRARVMGAPMGDGGSRPCVLLWEEDGDERGAEMVAPWDAICLWAEADGVLSAREKERETAVFCAKELEALLALVGIPAAIGYGAYDDAFTCRPSGNVADVLDILRIATEKLRASR